MNMTNHVKDLRKRNTLDNLFYTVFGPSDREVEYVQSMQKEFYNYFPEEPYQKFESEVFLLTNLKDDNWRFAKYQKSMNLFFDLYSTARKNVIESLSIADKIVDRVVLYHDSTFSMKHALDCITIATSKMIEKHPKDKNRYLGMLTQLDEIKSKFNSSLNVH